MIVWYFVNMKKTIVHVNQHVIRANTKNGEDNPTLTVKTYDSNNYAHEVEILDEQGRVVAKVVSRPQDPLSCGARVWISADYGVRLITDRKEQTLDPQDAELLLAQ